ncbi:MAG: hypothetical protein FWE16_00135 [Firmicutes bacterium]|nr:hypothetical protein [Bacillota bacterium]
MKNENQTEVEVVEETTFRRGQPWLRIFKIWAFWVVLVAFLSANTLVIIFGHISVNYGLTFNPSNIKTVEVWNGTETGFEMHFDTPRISEQFAMDMIFKMLHQSGSSNRLVQIFGARGEEGLRIESRTTNAIQNATDNHFIRITFRESQFGVTGTNNQNLELVCATTPHSRGVRQLFIPLGNIGRGFVQTSFFINTFEEPNDVIRYEFTTFGNFNRLSDFIKNFDWL